MEEPSAFSKLCMRCGLKHLFIPRLWTKKRLGSIGSDFPVGISGQVGYKIIGLSKSIIHRFDFWLRRFGRVLIYQTTMSSFPQADGLCVEEFERGKRVLSYRLSRLGRKKI